MDIFNEINHSVPSRSGGIVGIRLPDVIVAY